jgi:hypothetical protein
MIPLTGGENIKAPMGHCKSDNPLVAVRYQS